MWYTVLITYPGFPTRSDKLRIYLAVSVVGYYMRVNDGTTGYFAPTPPNGTSNWPMAKNVVLTSPEGAQVFNATLTNFTGATRSGTGTYQVKNGTPMTLNWAWSTV